MAGSKRKRSQRSPGRRGRTRPAFGRRSATTGRSRHALPENALFQTDPTYSKASLYPPKGWTDTVAGYIREAKMLTQCIVHNERLMEHPYQWHLTINFRVEQTPAEVRERWSKVCKRLRADGIVALWVMEVSRSNRVHFHLIVSNRIKRAALERAVKQAMPPRADMGWHKRIQRIEVGQTWRLAHYVTKAKIAGYVDGRPVEDYYARKRLLFKPRLGLVKYRNIGDFWERPKRAIWEEIAAKEARIAEGLDRPGVRELVQHVYDWLGGAVPLRNLERSFGYYADTEPVKRWAARVMAGDDGSYEWSLEHPEA